ncbi:CheR family methyltransferase [Candidatus Accumulibacter contiguus]|jgi:chemotaxis methyl-accepting protein methylase|uniref:CheR family methyltransferase n=1 Tax=Candidatus Accumulibacter contiguus TaxID=2954381 RepID=UPI002FC3905B
MAIRAESLQAMEFVEHNLVTDDAFLETQLLICRNVLIYFGAALQARALDLFERSLQRGGFLVLGSAESILDRDDTWAPCRPSCGFSEKPWRERDERRSEDPRRR